MDESFEIERIEEAVVAIETEPTLYECDDCVYKTKMKSNLFRHLRTRHRQPNDEGKSEQTRHELCSTCGKLYKSKYGLSLHIKSVHEKELKYHCNVCNKGFNTLWNYKGHLASHDKVLREKCDTCEAVFQYKKSLVAHKKICRINNQEESEIVCSTCKTKFTTKDALREHTYAIHEARTLPCQHCGKRYKWRSSLSKHQQKCG